MIWKRPHDVTGVWMIWKVSGWYDKRLHDLINVQIIWKCSANLWLKILQLSNRAAQKQTCWEKLRELINTPHLAVELEWGQMARKLTPSITLTPVKKSPRQIILSRNQQCKLEILFLQPPFTMNRRTWTSRAGLMVAWSPPDIQRLLSQLHSGNKVFENINFCEPNNVFHCVNICMYICAYVLRTNTVYSLLFANFAFFQISFHLSI